MKGWTHAQARKQTGTYWKVEKQVYIYRKPETGGYRDSYRNKNTMDIQRKV